MILHLVRHPKPDVLPGICYGQLDVAGLDVEGTAANLRVLLPAGLPVWSSPLQRCLALARALHPQAISDYRLAELNFGSWEGCRWDDIDRSELDAWAADVAGYAPPGGESPRSLQARALEFIATINVPEAIVVTHAGIIRTLIAHWRNLPPAQWPSLEIPYGSCTRISIPQ